MSEKDEQPEKLDLRSMDVAEEKRRQLKQLFPEVFTESNTKRNHWVEAIEFEKLREALGAVSEILDQRKEKFGLEWPGKRDCAQVVQNPTSSALKPVRKLSEVWDSAENVFIEGDNLEVLKSLQKSYYGKVSVVYIDPPYNTGSDFIYPDNYKESIDTYLEYTGAVDSEGKRFSTNDSDSGRYHSKWLSMIYPRVYVARNLMRDDGVFVSHIDEHEVENFLKVLDELFGAENRLGVICWDKMNPKGDAFGVATQHEYILIYTKNFDAFKKRKTLTRNKSNAEVILRKASALWAKVGTREIPDDLKSVVDKYDLPYELFTRFEEEWTEEKVQSAFQAWLAAQDFSGGEKAYRHIDVNGDVYRGVSMAWPNKKKAPDDYFIPLIHPTTKKPCPVPERGWRNPPKTMQKLLDEELILFGEDETKQPERKYLLRENMSENVPSVIRFGGSDDALLKRLGVSFDNPKPVKFAREIISWVLSSDSEDPEIVLDFFAGSGTAGHAVMQLSAEMPDSKCQFILIQLPEAANGAEGKISEIGIDRLSKARRAILDDNSMMNIEDLGFRVFKLAPSNFKQWEGDNPELSPDELAEQLDSHIDHIDPKASKEDLLYELLLKAGFMLSTKVDVRELAGHTVYSVEDGALLICLEKSVDEDLIRAVADEEPLQFICLDAAFQGNDQLKTNAVQTFKARSQSREEAIVFRTV